jgi:hypothetical protein
MMFCLIRCREASFEDETCSTSNSRDKICISMLGCVRGANLHLRITRISNSKRQFRSSLLAVDWTLLPIAERRLFLEESKRRILLGVAECRNYVGIQAQPHG